MLYRVHWKSRLTGKTGKSLKPMTKQEAEGLAKSANKDSDIIGIDHWVKRDLMTIFSGKADA